MALHLIDFIPPHVRDLELFPSNVYTETELITVAFKFEIVTIPFEGFGYNTKESAVFS